MRFRLRTLLIVLPVIIGAVVSSLVFGPVIGISPGDPRGPGIAAGWGGFAGLAIGLMLRVLIALKFTIRDVLWLMVVVAMGLGWFVSLRGQQTRLNKFMNEMVLRATSRNEELKKTRDELHEEIRQDRQQLDEERKSLYRTEARSRAPIQP